MRNIQVIILLLILAMATTCQQKPQQQEEEQSPAITEEGKADFKRIMPNFPSAAEYAGIIQSTGAEFTPRILTDPDLAGQYAENKEKAAAMLGMYMYDLGYCAAYQKSSYTDEYFMAAQTLAKSLGGEKGFLEMLMNRYHENINANDSVKAYFKEAYQHAVQEFGESENEREYLRTIFLAGFYIEGLHNTLQVINTYPKDELPSEQAKVLLMPIIRSVLKQEDNIYNLSKMLDEKVFELDNDMEYQNAFAKLNDTYQKLNVDQLISENRLEEIINNDVLQQLISEVESIRNKIISI